RSFVARSTDRRAARFRGHADGVPNARTPADFEPTRDASGNGRHPEQWLAGTLLVAAWRLGARAGRAGSAVLL
ncbi:MAG TPA: hypothetical protein DEP84_03065, partial [Chloroflexi bacterium]|nr:hypothetical protein [Chloroflexota bacterium]